MSRTPWPSNPTRPGLVQPGRTRFAGAQDSRPLRLSQQYPQQQDASGNTRLPPMTRADLPTPQPFDLPPTPQRQSNSGTSNSSGQPAGQTHVPPTGQPPTQPTSQPPAPPGQPPTQSTSQPPAPPGQPPTQQTSQPPAPPGQPPTQQTSQPPAPPGQPPTQQTSQPPPPPGQPPSDLNGMGPWNNGAGGEYRQRIPAWGNAPLSEGPGFPVTNYTDYLRSEMVQGRVPTGPEGETSKQEKERHWVGGLVGYHERQVAQLADAQRRQDENNIAADERAQRTNVWNRNTAMLTNSYNRETAEKVADRTVWGNRRTAAGVTLVAGAFTLASRGIPTPGSTGDAASTQPNAGAMPGAMAANSGQYVGSPSQNMRRFNPNAIPGQDGDNGIPQMPDWVKPDGAPQDPDGRYALDGQPYYAGTGYKLPEPTVPDPGIHDGIPTMKTPAAGMAKARTRRFQAPPQ